jgi:Holliday junction resolvasome RuvABC endonuclease subunit
MTDCRLMAIDPSLTCSGWALFSLRTSELLGVGKIRSTPPNGRSLSKRLEELQQQIFETFELLELGNGDLLVCEAPTTMRDPKAAFKVENVRGIFETVARGRGITVPGRLHPRSVQYEVMGLKGKQLGRELVKQTAVSTVSTLYQRSLQRLGFNIGEDNLKRNQDIVDAVLVGNLAIHRVQSAHLAGASYDQFFEGKNESRKRRW